jgi:adenine-specific DNA-methyltransferase
MDGKSLEILSDKITKLKDIIPEAFTEDKIDWEKLKAALGEDINFENERYNLNWAGKSDAFRVLQQRTSGTLRPVKDESVNFDKTENLFIEGENLEVLKILQKSYFGKIKMIYIDPPYNTGSDSFIYPDKFSETKDEYLKRIGDKDEEGFLLKEGFFRKNSKESGHYHSNWLSMMYPRLYTARNLLREDGVIFVSIDDNEVHNLRMIMNEIFGEENFVEQIIWKNKYGSGALTKGFANIHEYILCYSKYPIKSVEAPLSEEEIEKYKNHDSNFNKRGGFVTQPLATKSKDDRPNLYFPIKYNGKNIYPEKQWIWSKDRVEEALKNNEIVFNEKDGKVSVRMQQYLKNDNGEIRLGKPISIMLGPFNQEGTKEIDEIFDNKIFGFPKPVGLVKRFCSFIINGNEDKDEIILDFFAGSGTTAQAVMELNKEDGRNRKFILVQLPEKTDESSEAYKAKYFTIADICKERIRRVVNRLNQDSHDSKINTIKDKAQQKLFIEGQNQENPANQINHGSDNGFKVFKLAPSNFKMWRSDVIETEEDLNKMIDLFDTQIKPDAIKEFMFYELMLKSGFTLTDKVEKVNGYYSVNEGQAVFVLDKINQNTINQVIKFKPQSCIILDDLFAGNDQLKTNTALQMKDAEVGFITI